jgi:hypothetical protein
MRMLTATFQAALALVAGFLPHALHSQDRADEVAHRNDCRLAHQVLVHGQPANKYDWALSFVENCGTEGATALASELREFRHLHGRTVHLDQLVEIAQRMIDPELLSAARDIAADEQAGEAARIHAIRLLVAQVADMDLPYEAFTSSSRDGSSLTLGAVTSRGASILRTLPVDACDDALELLEQLAGVPADSKVRSAANQAFYMVEAGCSAARADPGA